MGPKLITVSAGRVAQLGGSGHRLGDGLAEIELRIAAFRALGASAKNNANQLSDEIIDEIYSLAASEQTDPKLRTAASSAFGALNLPSRKVKDLILDQSRS